MEEGRIHECGSVALGDARGFQTMRGIFAGFFSA
jgi:hypothetical protein